MYANSSDDSVGTGRPSLPDRRFAAQRGCERLLSGSRPQSLRERLAGLARDGEDVYDLDRRPDQYGDGVVRTLERRVADLLGTEDAAFFPTGTMAQQVAARIHAEAAGVRTVATHPLGHTDQHERHALGVLTGLRSVWPTIAPRLPTVDELRSFDEPYAAMILELPLREAGFVLPDWADLAAVAAVVREEHGAALHLDGARIWESVFHLGRSLPEISALADSVYVSFYKTLGGISGAALAGPVGFVRTAKAWRHRYGGQLFQQWPFALAALTGLDRELPRLEGYVTHARTVSGALAAAVAAVPGARVHPAPPHTHQFQLWLPHPPAELEEAGLGLAEDTKVGLFGSWREHGLPGLAMTEVTVASEALDWTPAEIAEAVAAFLDRLPKQTV
ncbi:threonine aldolase [Kitasatospora aureofaciens]|uniref:threonine aldolase family protein n=1 Tax=Kitasatospora aureofaciens TaxID=1894 RepID=UPI001C455915|nr:beta-eliminating lyase-related protein [Kitasatospora aureofaciens]MBV6697127.1 threonine aldolase [Kitasatospora aureofaciens]